MPGHLPDRMDKRFFVMWSSTAEQGAINIEQHKSPRRRHVFNGTSPNISLTMDFSVVLGLHWRQMPYRISTDLPLMCICKEVQRHSELCFLA